MNASATYQEIIISSTLRVVHIHTAKDRCKKRTV